MKEIQLHTSSFTSRLLIGESLQNAAKYLHGSGTVVISDENVFRHHGMDFPDGLLIRIEPGESSKTLEVVSGIYQQLIVNEVDRKSFILGIGGGIVCDIAGFVASTYLRGVSSGFVASTLLAQVDAGIGGKNGVNYEGYKNMIGTIRQPEFVICDPSLLKTLEHEEYIQGFAEVIKSSAISDASFFGYLEESFEAALKMDEEVLSRIIHESALAKSRIVERDEKESGERKKLNFGHTFAHAFEKLTGMPHGQAVSAGMVSAARISASLGMIPSAEVERICALLGRFGLPVEYTGDPDEVFEVMKRDKKRGGERISLVLLDRIGSAVVKDVSLKDLKNLIHDLS